MPKGVKKLKVTEALESEGTMPTFPPEAKGPAPITHEEFDALKKDVEFLSSTLADFLARGDKSPATVTTAPEAPISGENAVIKSEEKLSDVSALVHEILGPDFRSIVEPAQPGVSFIVKIFPPAHLCEVEGDMRAKVISNIEGLNGVRAYAEKVKAHIIGWAHKTGKVYMSA